MRKYYIDYLRNFTILLLFPVHTFMIWNDFGSGFYVWLGGNRLLSTLIVLVNPWFMPILFVLAGISARYSLKRRSYKEFILQRIQKLLIPFIAGLVLLVPFQTFYARKFFDAYEGGLWENWKYFFTHLTDFSGYDGAFTPGHLWFLLFLFVISMTSLLLFRWIPYPKIAQRAEQMSVWGLLLFFIPIWLFYHLGNFSGFSIGKDLALYLSSYYILSSDAVMETLEKNEKWLTFVWGISTAVSAFLYYRFQYYGDLWINFIGWISILILLIFAKKHWNQKTLLTDYFNRASYPIYLLHQSILVALAYVITQICDVFFIQMVSICVGSFILTVLAYHLIRTIPGVRKIIGIK